MQVRALGMALLLTWCLMGVLEAETKRPDPAAALAGLDAVIEQALKDQKVPGMAHGAAPLLVVVLELQWARILFPCVLLFALWLVLAALWPLRLTAQRRSGEDRLPTEAREPAAS